MAEIPPVVLDLLVGAAHTPSQPEQRLCRVSHGHIAVGGKSRLTQLAGSKRTLIMGEQNNYTSHKEVYETCLQEGRSSKEHFPPSSCHLPGL